jgi:integrase
MQSSEVDRPDMAMNPGSPVTQTSQVASDLAAERLAYSVGEAAQLTGLSRDLLHDQMRPAAAVPPERTKTGPVFVTERKARIQLPAADLDPSGRARLSCQQAAALFSAASGGETVHQFRHSALTHDAEDGTAAPVLMARSGQTSVGSLAKYARV